MALIPQQCREQEVAVETESVKHHHSELVITYSAFFLIGLDARPAASEPDGFLLTANLYFCAIVCLWQSWDRPW